MENSTIKYVQSTQRKSTIKPIGCSHQRGREMKDNKQTPIKINGIDVHKKYVEDFNKIAVDVGSCAYWNAELLQR